MDTKEATYFKSRWWLLTIQGILAILFGIAFVFWPHLSLITFVYLFAAYILAIGLISIFQGLISIGRGGGTWILTLLLGVLELGLGVFLFRHPTVAFATLILLVSFSLILYGVFGIVDSLSDKTLSSTGRIMSVIVGVLAGLAGIILLFQPVAGGVAFVWIVGIFALISGPIWIALSLEVKDLSEGKI